MKIKLKNAVEQALDHLFKNEVQIANCILYSISNNDYVLFKIILKEMKVRQYNTLMLPQNQWKALIEHFALEDKYYKSLKALSQLFPSLITDHAREAVHYAAYCKANNNLQLLLNPKFNLDPNALSPANGNTILGNAILGGNLEGVKMLLKMNNVDYTKPNTNNFRPIHVAIWKDEIDVQSTQCVYTTTLRIHYRLKGQTALLNTHCKFKAKSLQMQLFARQLCENPFQIEDHDQNDFQTCTSLFIKVLSFKSEKYLLKLFESTSKILTSSSFELAAKRHVLNFISFSATCFELTDTAQTALENLLNTAIIPQNEPLIQIDKLHGLYCYMISRACKELNLDKANYYAELLFNPAAVVNPEDKAEACISLAFLYESLYISRKAISYLDKAIEICRSSLLPKLATKCFKALANKINIYQACNKEEDAKESIQHGLPKSFKDLCLITQKLKFKQYTSVKVTDLVKEVTELEELFSVDFNNPKDIEKHNKLKEDLGWKYPYFANTYVFICTHAQDLQIFTHAIQIAKSGLDLLPDPAIAFSIIKNTLSIYTKAELYDEGVNFLQKYSTQYPTSQPHILYHKYVLYSNSTKRKLAGKFLKELEQKSQSSKVCSILYSKAKELDQTCRFIMQKKIKPQPDNEDTILAALQALFQQEVNSEEEVNKCSLQEKVEYPSSDEDDILEALPRLFQVESQNEIEAELNTTHWHIDDQKIISSNNTTSIANSSFFIDSAGLFATIDERLLRQLDIVTKQQCQAALEKGIIHRQKKCSGIKILNLKDNKVIELKLVSRDLRLIATTAYINSDNKMLIIFNKLATHSTLQKNIVKSKYIIKNSMCPMDCIEESKFKNITENLIVAAEESASVQSCSKNKQNHAEIENSGMIDEFKILDLADVGSVTENYCENNEDREIVGSSRDEDFSLSGRSLL
ncbi:ankyrin repeat domain-containing protein [Orientia tsutsugamushi]|uniref:Ankyrin repeats family protein n=2 Tax=Orientia tsutsugamushi str. TA716 TaxID=1359175 RepID=A0A0F3P724_ORITS|nr:ankyrin repeat domain-containing protein [Orientia tsutsugamushi]KJV75701.1 ankyrin repeats family protein [Orientia tsutsugamushi str. TA716]